MNIGTAEQEQNGVTIPNRDANTLPIDSRRPDRIRRQEHQDLGRLKDKELHRPTQMLPARQGKQTVREPVCRRRERRIYRQPQSQPQPKPEYLLTASRPVTGGADLSNIAARTNQLLTAATRARVGNAHLDLL
jgi:hypothetical protein